MTQLLNQNSPLVSVCIPTFNNAKFIKKTLDSIINQTHANIEIVVIDNASTDNTQEIVGSYSDNRIRYHRNSKTIHCLSNWNICIELAKSEFVAIYHSDDIYEPMIVEKEIEVLQQNHSIGAVFCLDNIIDENDQFVKTGANLPHYFDTNLGISFEELFPLMLNEFPSFIIAPTFMARKSMFKDVGFFDANKFGESLGSAGDTDLWLRISQKHDICILNERYIQRRVSVHQGSKLYSIRKVTRANHFVVLDNFMENPLYRKMVKDNVYNQYMFNKFIDDIVRSKNMITQGNKISARNLLMKAFSFNVLVSGFSKLSNMKAILRYITFLFLTFYEHPNRFINMFSKNGM